MRWIVAAVALVVGTGCGAARPLPSARLAYADLGRALRDPRGAAAVYAMLPPSARAEVTLADFSRRWDEGRAEREARAAGIDAALSQGGPTVEVDGGGRTAMLVEARDGWRVADPALGPAGGARTPGRAGVRAALRSVHSALQRRDFDALLRSLSGRLRGSVEAELASIAAATEDPAALEVLEIPGPTRVRLPDGRVIVLVWEAGQWRVDDVVGP